MDNEKFFRDFLQCISSKMADLSFKTWFSKVNLVSNKDNNLVFEVENKYKKDFIIQYYDNIIEEALEEISSSPYTYEILSSDEVKEEDEEVVVEINPTIPKLKENTGLLKNYTFDNYIVNDSNRLAKVQSLSVAEKPGKIYNPLFLYGRSGVGKTHLMNAIGNYINDNSDLKVLYVSIDTFINDFIYINVSRQDGSRETDNQKLVEEFKNKYRNIDVLIIDDIQLLSTAPKTQTEFFNTFEFLFNSNKQIILSSDRSPDDLKLLEDRLRTRFAWGLTLNIDPPDYDLRIRILKSKVKYLEISTLIKDEVYDYIANNFDSDVRHLEGAINTLSANIALLQPKEINLDFAMEVLKPITGSNIYIHNDVAKIQKAVADYFDLTVENLKSKKRQAAINNARQIAIYLCKMTTEETLERIGLEFNRDHATAIHAANKIEEELKTNEELRKQIKEIKEKISN